MSKVKYTYFQFHLLDYDNYNGFDNFARANYEVKIRISNGSHERNKKSTSLFKQNDENVIY